ncbi:purine-binding chemotaxis protein CheW [Candidatus Magnetomoraceae bacterium gMMP-15]
MMNNKDNNQITSDLWKNIKKRLKTAKQYYENGFQVNSEQKHAILKARAKVLAQKPEKKDDEDCLLVVEFTLAHERYAFELTHVREVYPLKELTVLPLTPSFVPGIINVRSQIISIVDMKKFFELPDEVPSNLNRVIILHSDIMEFGVLADEILGVSSIPINTIQSSLPTLKGVRAEYLKGITKDRLVILDGEKILCDPKIVVHEEVE